MTDGLLVENGDLVDLNLRAIGRQFDIKAATRHTAQVRLARRGIVIGVPVFLALVGVWIFAKPFRLPLSFDFSKVQIKGSRIDVLTPRLSGYRLDGTPYTVQASLGRQDLATPNIIEMQNVDADIGMADGTKSHVTASSGIYDSSVDGLRLTGAVRMRNTSGYDIQTGSASVDFKTGDVTAEASVHVALTGGNISADSMVVTNDGHQISFNGGVRSVFQSDDTPGGAVAQSERP